MIPTQLRRRPAPSTLAALLAAVLLALVAAGCGESSEKRSTGGNSEAGASIDEEVALRADSYSAPPTLKLDPAKTYPVEMETTKGTITVTVDPKLAPNAAANFVFLVKEGYYDGVRFHRVLEDFMVQAGDPTGTGSGGPGYALPDDPVKGTYERGVVAMANAGPGTGGSQFFIVQGTEVSLPPDYIIFGKVSEEDMQVVDELAGVEVEPSPANPQEISAPVKPLRIVKATVEA